MFFFQRGVIEPTNRSLVEATVVDVYVRGLVRIAFMSCLMMKDCQHSDRMTPPNLPSIVGVE